MFDLTGGRGLHALHWIDGVFAMTGGRGLHALHWIDGMFDLAGGRGLHALHVSLSLQARLLMF